jgi:pyruvate dehydrogenase E2 component (dihydrolipoamide acetyltransferase)
MTATAGALEVKVPDIGDFGDVPVIEILVAVGDTVAAEDPLVTLESDKATMDVPSPVAGTVRELRVGVGDRVSEGTPILVLESAGSGNGSPPSAAVSEPAAPTPEPAAPAAPEPAAPEPAAERAVAPVAAARSNGGGPVYASPSVRRLARELGVNLHAVSGSGRKGRITADDVRAVQHGGAVAAPSPAGMPGTANGAGLGLAPWPVVDFEKFGPVERVQRSRIQRISGPALARNWVMIPHVTQHDEADITELEAWRKQLNTNRDGVKFTMVSFLVAASVATLKQFPIFNASLDGDELVLRRYYNIGFAADTPGGLVVPVIKNADTKGLAEIARELTELSETARAGKLTPGDMSGGTFTISSLGGIGGTAFTPIINAPEVAILGVTRASMKPVWDADAGEFKPRLMVPLSLSYDHRVIDGAAAARFVVHLAGVLSDLRRALL